jgi:hypothetical protein
MTLKTLLVAELFLGNYFLKESRTFLQKGCSLLSSKRPPLVAIKSQILLVHSLLSHVSTLIFNIILPSLPRSSKRSYFFMLPYQSHLRVFITSHMCHTPLLNPHLFNPPNNVMFVSINYKLRISPQNTVDLSTVCRLLLVWGATLHTHN